MRLVPSVIASSLPTFAAFRAMQYAALQSHALTPLLNDPPVEESAIFSLRLHEFLYLKWPLTLSLRETSRAFLARNPANSTNKKTSI